MYKKISTFLFVGFISAFFIWLLLSPDKKFSEEEYRYLQTFPTFRFEDLKKGKYTSDFENYVKDQFPMRESFISLKAASELLQGRKENNGVFYAKDSYAFSDLPYPEKLSKNIEVLKTFCEKNSVPITVVLVPGQAEILKEKLPSYVYTKELYEETIEKLSDAVGSQNVVDLYPEFQEKTAEGKELYFRTDHHFNTLGAYTAYSKLAEKMGISPYPEQDFQKTEVTDSFLGTMYSKSGFRFLPPDTMERWDLSEEEKYTLYTADDDTTREGLYFEENLLVKDKYTYFLGGNHALQVIKKNTPGEKVLLIKDSYAHIAAPFIARHFSETHLLDLRYFKKNVSNYIAEEKIDRVIVMYSLSEFLESINFGTLK